MLIDDYATDEEIMQRAAALAQNLLVHQRILLRLPVMAAPVLTIRTLIRVPNFRIGRVSFPAPSIHPYGLGTAGTPERWISARYNTLALVGLELFRTDTISFLANAIKANKAPRYIIATPTLGEVKNEARLLEYAQLLNLKTWEG